MSDETRLDEIRAREAAATKGPWETPAIGIVADTANNPLAVFGGGPQDIADAEFTANARDDIPYLLDQLGKYVGKEPTVAEEMRYLGDCLDAVLDLCERAERDALRWEHPLPVPEWVQAVRKAVEGGRPDVPGDNQRPVVPGQRGRS